MTRLLILALLMAATAMAQDALTVLTLNFACRDLYPLAACDNCQTRFDLMASAFVGAIPVEGLPNLDQVDVVMAQELGTSAENFAQISNALTSRGFLYSTGEPAPTARDPICQDPILWGQTDKQLAADFTGLQSGGLVTWSRYPIMDSHEQNWCNHLFPVPSGYLLTLLDIGGGRVAAVLNLHATPEYDWLGTRDMRTYQFGEVSALATTLEESFRDVGVAFSIMAGGDFNEDAFGGRLEQSTTESTRCRLIQDNLVQQKFASLNLDILQACQDGILGTPTWNTSSNDLAMRHSSTGSSHQILDYLIQHSSSASSSNTPTNVVSTFKTKTPWRGQFCRDNNKGEAIPNNLYTSTAYALSDHSIVTASFPLPNSSSSDPSLNAAFFAFKNAMALWTAGGKVDEAACGQENTVCRTDADCCSAQYSWNGQGQHCDALACSSCAALGQGCGAQLEGSECCGYHDYSSGRGTHCEMDGWFATSATCILKFSKGETCLWDEECQSKQCSWTWRGKKCQ